MTAKRVGPVWLDAKIALAVHDRQLAEHGGGQGIRDHALLESALARPVNQWATARGDPLRARRRLRVRNCAQPPVRRRQQADAWVFARLFLAFNGRAALRAGGCDPGDARACCWRAQRGGASGLASPSE